MTATYVSDESVVNGTGRSWQDWFTALDDAGARDLTHQQIARWLGDTGGVDSGWWCQQISGSYERHIGRRVEGQTCTGDFKASASRTFAAGLDDVLARWCDQVAGATEFNGVPLVEPPATAESEKWRYWRAKLADGGRLTVSITHTGSGKTGLGVSHDKITDPDAVEGWKLFWRKLVKDLPAG